MIYRKLNTVEYAGLMETVVLTNRVAVTLAHIYRTGFAVDLEMLDKVKTEFELEKSNIEKR